MQEIVEKKTGHIGIDILGFWAGNYLIHSAASSFPKPKVSKVVIFGVSDMLTRYSKANWWEMKMLSGVWGENAKIALVSFVMSSLYDLLNGSKDTGKIITDNLMLNAVGFISNSLIDKVVPMDTY
jgi:hypothetical protein